MSWYCDAAKDNPIHETYHDQEYGFPLKAKNARDDERYLFELQSLELFQAGLSWELILKKRPTTVMAFDNFDVDRDVTAGVERRADVRRPGDVADDVEPRHARHVAPVKDRVAIPEVGDRAPTDEE